MKHMVIDIAVIGGGPAGMAAALEANRLGAKNVVILERDFALGGILPQCIHDGFGLLTYGKNMTGSGYAQKDIDEIKNTDIQVLLNTMVLEITEEKTIFACNSQDGIIEMQCGTIILAMGCRERTAGQIMLQGYRPQGVITAGSVQRYINIEGYLPGTKAVILGSGDIGLIMARRMTLEGIEVVGVYEVMPYPGGLTRNIVQCLEDFDIPLHLSHAVTNVNGKHSLEGLTVMELDGSGKPVAGTEVYIECDLLVLAVGLIPENELSSGVNVALDPKTKGPILDDDYMTSVSGIFAAGNVSVVFDLVDYVSQSGRIAANGAVKYINGQLPENPEFREVKCGGNINFVVPQRIKCSKEDKDITLFMRVKEPAQKAVLVCSGINGEISRKRHNAVVPPEMLSCSVCVPGSGDIEIGIKESVKKSVEKDIVECKEL